MVLWTLCVMQVGRSEAGAGSKGGAGRATGPSSSARLAVHGGKRPPQRSMGAGCAGRHGAQTGGGGTSKRQGGTAASQQGSNDNGY